MLWYSMLLATFNNSSHSHVAKLLKVYYWTIFCQAARSSKMKDVDEKSESVSVSVLEVTNLYKNPFLLANPDQKS